MPAAQSLLSLVKEECQLKGELREFFPSPLGMLTCQQDCTSPTPPHSSSTQKATSRRGELSPASPPHSFFQSSHTHFQAVISILMDVCANKWGDEEKQAPHYESSPGK